VWDREAGCARKGSLRITNAETRETVWGCEPFTQIPPETKLSVRAKIKTQGVEGKGCFIRLRTVTWVWQPAPHAWMPVTLESDPVSGTTDDWVSVEVPLLRMPKAFDDFGVMFELVLDGKGVAWVTDLDIDLQADPESTPQAAEGSQRKATVTSRAGAAGAAM
jgi:hypothetical protein